MKTPQVAITSAPTLAQSLILILIEITVVYHCWFSLLPSLIANMALNLPKTQLLKYVPGSPLAVLFTPDKPSLNAAWLYISLGMSPTYPTLFSTPSNYKPSIF